MYYVCKEQNERLCKKAYITGSLHTYIQEKLETVLNGLFWGVNCTVLFICQQKYHGVKSVRTILGAVFRYWNIIAQTVSVDIPLNISIRIM